MILITTTKSLISIDIETEKQKIIHREMGVYYGITSDENFVYVSARRAELFPNHNFETERGCILVFDKNMEYVKTLESPFPLIDMHGILYNDNILYITSSFNNLIAMYDTTTEQWNQWYPLGVHDRDVYHFNSLYIENNDIYMIAHNFGESELYKFDKIDKSLKSKIKFGVNSHTIWKENESIFCCDSLNNSIISNNRFKLEVEPKKYTRGYLKTKKNRLVGLSELSAKENRSFVSCYINVYDNDWNKEKTLVLENEGQIYEIFEINI
jgi:hypothetical protein